MDASAHGPTGGDAGAGTDLGRLLDSAYDAYVAIDGSGLVTDWNSNAEATFGYGASEALGKRLGDLIVPEAFRERHEAGLRRVMGGGHPRILDQRLELTAIRRDGRQIPIKITLTRRDGPSGTRFHAFIRDLSAQVAGAAARNRLASIVDASSDAIISGTTDGVVQSWNAAAERLTGYSSSEVIGHSIAEFMPADAIEGLTAMRGKILEGHSILDLVTEGTHRNGTRISVSVSISPILNDLGEVVAMSSIARDISQGRRTEMQLSEALQRFEAAFNHAPVGMALVSLDGRFIDANDSLCTSLGRTSEELCGLTFQEITYPDDLDDDLQLLDDLLAGERTRYSLEKRYIKADGSTLWALLHVSLVRSPDGSPVHFVSQVQDITGLKEQDLELRRAAEHLNDLSLHDPLTGLHNYRAFAKQLASALESGEEKPFALALLDVTNLNPINREHGHLGGDRALRDLASLLRLESRESDEIFRIGGSEFAMLLPGAERPEAAAIVERIGVALAESACEATTAHGISAFPIDGRTHEELMQHADVALYAAGRRRDPRAEDPAPGGLTVQATQRIRRVLALAREQLRLDAFLYCELDDTEEIFRIADGDATSFGLEPGTRIARADTYCQRLIDGDIERLVRDTTASPDLRGLALTSDGSVGAYMGAPLRGKDGNLLGVICGFSHEPTPDLSDRDADLLTFLGSLVTETIERDEDEARERTAEIEFSGVSALVAALEARDHYTGEHSRGVVELATSVAVRLGRSEEEVAAIEQVAILHDIGKVAIPDSILLKPSPLTDAEWMLMRQHPAVGERIVASTETLAHLAPAIRAEHERYDGRGYPDGLEGELIPMISRITLACDAYHAMTSNRPYRRAMSQADAVEELRRNAGSQFDPRVVDALMAELDERSRDHLLQSGSPG